MSLAQVEVAQGSFLPFRRLASLIINNRTRQLAAIQAVLAQGSL